MKNYSTAIQILRKVEEEERNWRSGLLHIGELLEAAEKAEKLLAGFENDKGVRQSEIAELDRLIAQRRQDAEHWRRQAETLKPDSARVRELDGREKSVGAREAEVAAREQRVSAREEKAKELVSQIAGFSSLDDA